MNKLGSEPFGVLLGSDLDFWNKHFNCVEQSLLKTDSDSKQFPHH